MSAKRGWGLLWGCRVSKEFILVMSIMISLLIGLYSAESDIKRDCDRLGRVVLLNQSFECKAVAK
jgi:hypothetical protein